jgi:hypothetical protein
MQQYHWLPFAAVPHAERHIADIDAVSWKPSNMSHAYPAGSALTIVGDAYRQRDVVEFRFNV